MQYKKEYSQPTNWKDISGGVRGTGEFVKTFIPHFIDNIKKSLKVEPHKLDEIRAGLIEDSKKDLYFFSLIEKHHGYLLESISVLNDRKALASEKKPHLSRFMSLLKMHTKAEEETLYRSLVKSDSKEARLEGIAGQDIHDIANQLAQELSEMNFEYVWTDDIDAKAKVLATIVGDHIKEEERIMFPVIRDNLTSEELESLTGQYLQKCINYLEEEMITPFFSEAFVFESRL